MTQTWSGSWSDWIRPCQQAYMQRRELPARLTGFFVLPAHSLCYPSPPTQVGSYPGAAILPDCMRGHRELGSPIRALLCWCSPAVNSSAVAPTAQSDRLRVVLVAPRNPLNIGAAARAMSNFGFFHLRVVNPYELAFREARSAVGAAPLLAKAEEVKTVAEAIQDCTLVVGTTALRQRQLHHPVRRLDQASRPLRKRLATGRVALLFGSDKRGLSNQDLSH